ncbi:putative SAP domain, Zinc finger, MIZ-type, Zinc finger, RING/FYVE/PHD-type, PINIT [Septoria linicola]|nr:putative SAP domain, Zinc finger, MIZ-type, Zinc finger, RING/FYVE/PHD-type, PINIT [Septoria linicola]
MAASGGHMLQQQKSSLETRIKTLVNNDLKDICRAYNYQVSGQKAALQKRCVEILETIVAEGDVAAFRDLNFRVNNHGKAPPPQATQHYSHSSTTTNGYGQYQGTSSSPATMAPGRAPAQLNGTHRASATRMWFKSSPFYEDHEAVYPLQDLPESRAEMPQNRHTVRGTISLSPDQSQRMKADPSLKLLLYCGKGANHYSLVDVEFPNQLEVKINNDDVKSNFKGLKGKPGTTKPADITDKIRKNSGYQNQLSITYALTKERFHIGVYLVRYVPSAILTQRIKDGRHGGGVISKEQAIREINKANDDPDIVLSSEVMSLKDPVSTLRITLPVRSTVCTHRQCFDGSMFLQMQEQAPQWLCPTCNKSVSYQSLCIDKYFEEILQKTASSIEKVTVEPDGQWHIIKEEDSQPANQSSRGNRAKYDDDFDDDDDLIEVTSNSAPKPRPTNGVPLNNSTSSLLSPMPGAGYAMTPPLSSRGPSAAPSTSSAQTGGKRAVSSVIDLTLSDDDEPPRPAKRQSTNTSTHSGLTSLTSQSYSTPTSLPDPRYTSYPGGQSNSTDAFRASVNTTRPSSNHSRGSAAPEQYGVNQYMNHEYGSRSGSPFRAGSSASPSFTNNNWATYSRPASTLGSSSGQGFQTFAIRPPTCLGGTMNGSTSAGDGTAASTTSQQPPLRLPPINPNPPSGYSNASWRSGSHSSYSQSPNG